ncbi:hypothetical protein ACFFV7_46140 [Nonomuraea spiralis]|uniref:Uncharacterized protein n=1 Tax=Nonomuraea spiralis TaxID=46182 RepID=A0ABV5IVU8_9ACTN|nr:hypothetical protein [Nonomuraea spiralis]GGS83948.1 hypothetical protein GCM10010176_029480 [Nonomuraea spiralis]
MTALKEARYCGQTWYDDYVAGFASRIPNPNRWTPRHLRRVTPIKLVEMTAGGTWKQCAAALGISVTAAGTSFVVLRRQIAGTGLWPQFESIVEQLANSLDQTRRRTDYARRRRALHDWEIPVDHWQAICTDVYQAGPYLGPQDPAIGTALIRAEATQAEHLHSPRLTKLRHQEASAARALKNKIALFRTPATRTGANLTIRNRISKYAHALAARCDADTEPTLDIAELQPWEPESRGRRRRPQPETQP